MGKNDFDCPETNYADVQNVINQRQKSRESSFVFTTSHQTLFDRLFVTKLKECVFTGADFTKVIKDKMGVIPSKMLFPLFKET